METNKIESKVAGQEKLTDAARVAREFKSMLDAGSSTREVRDALLADDCVYCDAFGGVYVGREAIEAGVAAYMSEHEFLMRTFSEPLACAERFAMFVGLKLRNRKTGEFIERYELGIFDVKDGKITREEFVTAPRPA